MSDIRQVNKEGRIVEPAAVTEATKETTEALIDKNADSYLVGDNPLRDALLKSVEQVMGLDNDSERYRYRTKIQTLLEWAKTQVKEATPENIAWAIRSLELKIGTPPLAEKRVNYVARMAYLLTENKKIEGEIKNLTTPQ